MATDRPSFAVLLDWVEGRLEPARASEVAAAVSRADDDVRDEVEWIHGFLADTRKLPLEQPPADLSARLRGAFVGLRRPSEGLAWTEASPLYDSRDQLAAVGVRSAQDGVNLAFDSELGRFVVEVVPSGPAEVEIQGLLRAEDGVSGVDVALLEGGTLRRAGRVERDGRFDLVGVPATVDELWLTAGETRVRAGLNLSLT